MRPAPLQEETVAGPDAATRKKLANQGKAMPDGGTGSGGRFPIRNEADARKAIKAIGRVRPEDRAKVIRFIKRRLRELGLTRLIPEGW
jgi:hypothetical protein